MNDKLKDFINSQIKDSKGNLNELKSFLSFLNNKIINIDYKTTSLTNFYIPSIEEVLKENRVNWIFKLILLSAFCKLKNIKYLEAFDLGNRFTVESIIKNISPENINRILLKLNINKKEYIFGKIDKGIPFGYNFAEGNLIAYV